MQRSLLKPYSADHHLWAVCGLAQAIEILKLSSDLKNLKQTEILSTRNAFSTDFLEKLHQVRFKENLSQKANEHGNVLLDYISAEDRDHGGR